MEPLIVYEPNSSLKRGYLHLLIEIVEDIVKNRWLTYQLFKRDFFALYRQSFLGFLWAFIIPIVSVGTFILLSQSGIFSIGDINIPYPLYAIIGMAFWQIFSMGMIASTNSLVNAGQMIVKINISKKSLVIASMGQSIVSFIIQLLLVGVLFVYYGIAPNVAILLIPILIIPLILLTMGLGFILSLLNSVVRDIGNLISLLLTFLMFLTPILYVKPNVGILGLMTQYNPLYYLINSSRELILNGSISDTKGFFISCLLSILVFVVCLLIFHITETKIAERV